MKRFLSLVLLLLTMTTGVMAQTDLTEIPGSTLATLKLREGPGTEFNVVTTLTFGTKLTIEGRNYIGNWMLVRSDADERGWVASRYVSWSPDIELAQFVVTGELLGAVPEQPTVVSPATAATPVSVVINGVAGRSLARINVRSGPDINAPLVDRINYRTELVIEARNNIGNWLLISTTDGEVRGWAASRFVSWSTEIELASFPISTEGIETILTPETTDDTTVPAAASEVDLLPAGTTAGRTLVTKLNLRAGPGTAFESLSQLDRNVRVIIEGRNFIGDWLLISTLDGSARGWVASRFIGWSEEVPLGSFPVTGEEIQP